MNYPTKLKVRNKAQHFTFSAAKAALDMKMSVSQSVCNAYLFVRFTSIFYNSKSDKLKLSLIINQKTSNMILKITRTLELKAFAVPGTLVLVIT